MNSPLKKNITAEAIAIRESELDHGLVKVFAGDWKGTREERALLKKLKKERGEAFYRDVVFLLTCKRIDRPQDARKMFLRIRSHKRRLEDILSRPVGIEVAALDYSKNVLGLLEEPALIEKEKLVKIASKAVFDKTTGLYDRDALKSALEEEIRRARRYRIPLSILFCDLDNFKEVNDTFGHPAGDRILKDVSRTIKQSVRAPDRLFRFGGEEFVCMLPETRLDTAAVVAERINRNVAAIDPPKPEGEKPLSLTMSIGIAQFGTGDIRDGDTLISAADTMMYEAKKAGKNRVCLFRDARNEPVDDSASSTRTSTTPTRERKVFHGEKLSGGYALGKAFIYRDIFSRRLRTYSIRESDIPFEKKRIQNAIRSVRNELSEARDFIQNSMTDEDAEIFEVHRMILKDPRLLRDFETELVSERINAEQVVKNVFRKWIRRFESSESDRLSNRAEDLRDLNRKILCVLLGYEMNVLEKLPSNSIVIARRLLPSDTLNIRRKNLKGIITEEGSSLSHSAILARNLGIPAVSGLGRIEKIVTSKTRIMLDGTAGKVILNPRREEAAALRKKIAVLERRRTFCIRRASKESATRDGTKVNVFANAASAKDMQNAVDSGADGIGLFRTEQVYMSSNRMPGEDELFERFRSIMKPAGKRDVVVRLLDIGGDKRLPYIPMEEELSPFLGLRGIRILLKHENLLRTQIRVILKLRREFNVRLLIPMVTLPEEIKRVAAMIRECRDALNRRFRKKIPSLETGAMIETPAAVSSIYRFANQSDFFSIGTNDLIQYTMCAGRENASVSYYYDKGRAIMIRTIRKIVRAANKKKIGVSLCGELANDPAYTEKLLRTGLRTLSVFPHQIPEIKESIRQVRL